jgi:hypothetical protein
MSTSSGLCATGWGLIKALRNLFTNRWLLFAIGIYIAGLAVLSRRPEFSLSDALLRVSARGFVLTSQASS